MLSIAQDVTQAIIERGELSKADIRGFFDNLDHEKLIELLELRIDDKPFLKSMALT